jgi:hypothetical protein
MHQVVVLDRGDHSLQVQARPPDLRYRRSDGVITGAQSMPESADASGQSIRQPARSSTSTLSRPASGCPAGIISAGCSRRIGGPARSWLPLLPRSPGGSQQTITSSAGAGCPHSRTHQDVLAPVPAFVGVERVVFRLDATDSGVRAWEGV